MIEGLKVTVPADEVKDLCLKRAEHHRQRAKQYQEQQAKLADVEIEPGKFSSGGDPREHLADKVREHQSAAAEMDFIASHIAIGEAYLLSNHDLFKLGISSTPRW